MGVDPVPIGVGRLIPKQLILEHQPDDIDSESVHPAVQPEAHMVQHRRQYSGIAVVEFGLLRHELMQVILPGVFIKRPSRTAKETQPVVGWSAVWSRVAPDIPISFSLSRLLRLSRNHACSSEV